MNLILIFHDNVHLSQTIVSSHPQISTILSYHQYLSTIKHYAKLLQCPIVMCPEFIRDFLIRNNRQASTSRSCFPTTLNDARLIHAELLAANVPLPATSKDDEALLLTKKRKHVAPKG